MTETSQEMPELQHWGYNFYCWKSIGAMFDAFNASGPWKWERGDSDIYGFYLRCRPYPSARIAVYNQAEFRTSSGLGSWRFWAELYSESGARPEIDQQFLRLLKVVKARRITED
jgi:hypothetical protein